MTQMHLGVDSGDSEFLAPREPLMLLETMLLERIFDWGKCMGRLERPAMTGEMTGTTSDDGAAAPRAGGGGGGSSDPRAGSEGGFRCRSHGARAGSARIDRVGLAQARRRSAMSDDCWRLREATAELAAPYGGAQGGAAAAGASERGGRAVQDCGRQRGRAARRHAAPRCALRPSLPLVFSSRSVRRRHYLLRTRCGAQGTAVAAGASERGGRAVQDCGWQRGRAGRRHAAPWCALRPSLPLVFRLYVVSLAASCIAGSLGSGRGIGPERSACICSA